MKIRLLASFFSIHRTWKMKETHYKLPQGVLTMVVQMIRTLLWDLKGWQKKNFSKNSFFRDEKSFWRIFPRNIEYEKHQGTIYKGPEIVLTFTLELVTSFFEDLRSCWKHKFLKKKKGNPSSEEKKRPIFSRFIEQGKLMEQFIKAHKMFWLWLFKRW